MYIVAYIKFKEEATTLRFEGPFIMSPKAVKRDAEKEAARLVRDNRDKAVIPKVLSIPAMMSREQLEPLARDAFDSTIRDMIEAKKMLSRKRYKRAKRKVGRYKIKAD